MHCSVVSSLIEGSPRAQTTEGGPQPLETQQQASSSVLRLDGYLQLIREGFGSSSSNPLHFEACASQSFHGTSPQQVKEDLYTLKVEPFLIQWLSRTFQGQDHLREQKAQNLCPHGEDSHSLCPELLALGHLAPHFLTCSQYPGLPTSWLLACLFCQFMLIAET